MRILLTGTSGQVGGALQPLLSTSYTLLAPKRAEFDLSQPETIAGSLDRLAPDLIINPAAYTAVDKAEDEVELALRVNAASPAAMAAWAAKRSVPLIQFSTDYVFNGSGETPWREEDKCAPLSSYGRSKREGERSVQAAGGPHLIVRTSWVYAAQGTNFLRTMSRLARERQELRVVADQFGAPTAAASIAEATVDIIGRSRSTDDVAKSFEAAGGIVHLANAGTTTWHGFATAIVAGLKARGQAVKTETVHAIATSDFPTKAIRPLNSRLDTSRLRQTFGISMPDWDSSLQRELDRLIEIG